MEVSEAISVGRVEQGLWSLGGLARVLLQSREGDLVEKDILEWESRGLGAGGPWESWAELTRTLVSPRRRETVEECALPLEGSLPLLWASCRLPEGRPPAL